MPRSGKLPVLDLLTGQKSGFSPHRGDALHRFTSSLAWPTDTRVRLAVQNFTSIDAGGWECDPQNIKKIPLFGKESGRLPCPISKIFGGCYTPSHAALAIQIWHDSLHRLRSYCWETACRSIRPNFSVHPVGKTMCLVEKWISTFAMGTTSSITVQSLGKIVQRAPAVGAKMWCFFLSRSESGVPCVRGVHSSNKHCVAVYCPISTRFTIFFRRDALHSSHFRR